MTPLVKRYHEAVRSGATHRECISSLDELVNMACAMKDIDPMSKENRKQIKFQLLSHGDLESKPAKLHRESSSIGTNGKSDVFDLCWLCFVWYNVWIVGLVLFATMAVNTINYSTALDLKDNRKKNPFTGRHRCRPVPKNVCTTGANSRKKDARRSRRYHKSRVSAGMKRSRNQLRLHIPRAMKHYLREQFQDIHQSFQVDLHRPGAFADANVRYKYQQLAGES